MARNPENLEAPNKSEVKPPTKPDTVRQLGSVAIRGTQAGK
jgi:hypothetical protein